MFDGLIMLYNPQIVNILFPLEHGTRFTVGSIFVRFLFRQRRLLRCIQT